MATITDFLQAGAKWLNTARKAVATQPTTIQTESGNYSRNATVVQAHEVVIPGQLVTQSDITLFLYDRSECTDINFKRGVCIVWNDENYDVVIDRKIQSQYNDQFQYDLVVPAKLVK